MESPRRVRRGSGACPNGSCRGAARRQVRAAGTLTGGTPHPILHLTTTLRLCIYRRILATALRVGCSEERRQPARARVRCRVRHAGVRRTDLCSARTRVAIMASVGSSRSVWPWHHPTLVYTDRAEAGVRVRRIISARVSSRSERQACTSKQSSAAPGRGRASLGRLRRVSEATMTHIASRPASASR